MHIVTFYDLMHMRFRFILVFFVFLFLGPTALVQFHIWECGDLEKSVLKDKLIQSLKHALCDVMMEYYVLTAPICEIPKRLQELMPQPTMSAPSSPFFSSPGINSCINLPGTVNDHLEFDVKRA